MILVALWTFYSWLWFVYCYYFTLSKNSWNMICLIHCVISSLQITIEPDEAGQPHYEENLALPSEMLYVDFMRCGTCILGGGVHGFYEMPCMDFSHRQFLTFVLPSILTVCWKIRATNMVTWWLNWLHYIKYIYVSVVCNGWILYYWHFSSLYCIIIVAYHWVNTGSVLFHRLWFMIRKNCFFTSRFKIYFLKIMWI